MDNRKRPPVITDQRPFTIIYNDFLESDLFNWNEKRVFIYLKKFADSRDQCFPSIRTLEYLTQMSRPTVIKALNGLIDKGAIRKDRRVSEKYGNTSNLYTIYDTATIWGKEPVTDEMMIEALKRRGYEITKKELPQCVTDQSTQESPETKIDYTPVSDDCQSQNEKSEEQQPEEPFVERYSMEFVRQHYDYSILIDRLRYETDMVDSVLNVIYNTLNTENQTIRIGGESKPADIVRNRLLKLWYEDILYVIDQYKAQTGRIRHPIAYILKMLYVGKEQGHLDVTNQVRHDMENWNFQSEDQTQQDMTDRDPEESISDPAEKEPEHVYDHLLRRMLS